MESVYQKDQFSCGAVSEEKSQAVKLLRWTKQNVLESNDEKKLLYVLKKQTKKKTKNPRMP